MILVATYRSDDMLTGHDDGLYLVLIVITWPICIIAMSFVMCLEVYKHKLRARVDDKVLLIRRDPTNIAHMNIKDLKLILFADKLNAISLDDKLIDKVKSSIIDRSFEDLLLKTKDN